MTLFEFQLNPPRATKIHKHCGISESWRKHCELRNHFDFRKHIDISEALRSSEFFYEWRAIILSWLEAYTRRENVRIFNVKEEVDENTEVVMRNLLVTKMQIPLEKVQSIRFERATPHF